MEILETLQTILGKYFLAQKSGDTNEMVSVFQELVGARNYLAVSKGFSNYLDLQKNFFRISESHWQKYLSNRDAFASKFSPQLESSSNNPHFLSKLPSLKISFPNGVFDHVSQTYPEITKLKDKIILSISDEGAHYKYSKDEDSYSIFIPHTNHNQQVSMLIHELAHILSQEKHQHQILGGYEDELEAHQIEFGLVRKFSNSFFQAVVGEYLICLVRTEFQISMFENHELDSTPLYTSCFEKYVGKQNPENILDYLSDKKIINLPLTDLSVAVALVILLS